MMPAANDPVAPMPLFERLEDNAPFSATEIPIHRTLTAIELRASVRAELIRLLNTRRGRTSTRRPLDVLDYGLQDWSARSAARAADRSGLERAVVEAIEAFEPRLKQPRAQIEPEPDAPWRLRLRIVGTLDAGAGPWPVAFVAQLADGQPVGVVDERIA
ncbi:type VI secretion system baseplate subunit TssE [Paraburkholderia acidicola]|uniref:Type VI secretion system baseplate subunit TssE n=1 Tax=Paraburkholderia acidicola TaxID=1912599 RepID=A0ABV1LVY3_9BURK